MKAPIGAIRKFCQLNAKALDFENKVNLLIQQDTVDYLSQSYGILPRKNDSGEKEYGSKKGGG